MVGGSSGRGLLVPAHVGVDGSWSRCAGRRGSAGGGDGVPDPARRPLQRSSSAADARHSSAALSDGRRPRAAAAAAAVPAASRRGAAGWVAARRPAPCGVGRKRLRKETRMRRRLRARRTGVGGASTASTAGSSSDSRASVLRETLAVDMRRSEEPAPVPPPSEKMDALLGSVSGDIGPGDISASSASISPLINQSISLGIYTDISAFSVAYVSPNAGVKVGRQAVRSTG